MDLQPGDSLEIYLGPGHPRNGRYEIRELIPSKRRTYVYYWHYRGDDLKPTVGKRSWFDTARREGWIKEHKRAKGDAGA